MATPRPDWPKTGRRWFVLEGESDLLWAVPFGKTEVDGSWWDEVLDPDGEKYYLTDEVEWYGLTAEEFGDTPEMEPGMVVLNQINCDCEQVHDCEVCSQRGVKALAMLAVETDDVEDPRVFMICPQHTVAELADFLGYER